MKRLVSPRSWPALVVGAWVGAVGLGLAGLASYAATPGARAGAPAAWPVESAIAREPGKATLVLFLHPRCPCSTATIGELQRALACSAEPARVCVVFSRPAGTDPEWSATALRERAASLNPSAVVDDAGGVEAARFGAATSGEVVIYDATGKLAFSGGVTGSRGHEGDNAGRSAVGTILAGERVVPGADRTPVFGCPLCAHEARVGGGQ